MKEAAAPRTGAIASTNNRPIEDFNMATMKQYQTSAPTSNLNNIGNFTSSYTGDLIFSVNDFIHLPATFSVYCISGTEIIVSEFPSPIILAILIAAAWLLMAILRRKHFGIE